MPFVTKRQPLILSAAERKVLEDLRRSRSAEKRQVLHAAILLESANGVSDNAVAVANGVKDLLQIGVAKQIHPPPFLSDPAVYERSSDVS
jgi:hypothetical protein